MKTVFFDVDTQLDFLFPAGALYVPGAERIAPALASLTALAANRQIPIVSTLDTHRENDPEFKEWQPHCVAGTQGQQKWSRTMVEHGSTEQILFEKNKIDFFGDPRLDRILANLNASHFVVYGVATEHCVRSVVFGLLERKLSVDVVTDAVQSLNEAEGGALFERFTAGGGRLVSLNDLFSI